MKNRIFLIILGVINILLIGEYIFINNKYEILKDKFNLRLDNVSYEEKMNDLNSQYNEIIGDISNELDEYFEELNEIDDLENKLRSEYDDMVSENKILLEKKESLSKQKKTLENSYNSTLQEIQAKKTFMISNVPKINQYSLGYPTGCESAALTVLLRYWGLDVNMSDIVSKLAKGSKPYYEDGIRYGGNPYLEFVGHPNDYGSYGTFDKPIEAVANQFKSGIINGTGMSLDQVLEIVYQNRPVIVWTTSGLSVPYISNTWIYKNTGETIKWISGEHALVVVGYNDNQVIVSDSLTGTIRYFDRSVFESRYNTFSRRALYY